MIAIFKKIWLFAGEEQKNIRNSVCIGFINAIFHMLQIGALFLTIRALVRESVDTSLIWSVVSLMLISIVGKIVTNYFSQLMQTHGGFYMAANKRVDIANRMKLIPMGYYNQSSLGNITGIATTVLSDVEMTAPIVMVLTLGGFITTVIFLLYMLIFDWRMGLLATLWVVLFLFIISSMEKKSRESAPKRQLAQASLVECVLETIQGMSVVKSFHLTKMDDKKIDKAIDQSKNRNLAMEKLLTPYTILQQSILRIGSVSLMAAALLFYFAGTMELTYAIMFIVVSFIIFEQIESVGYGMSILRVCGSSIEQANQIDAVPVMDVNGKAQISGSHDIEFEHVHFSYEKRKILDGITVNLPEGTMTAIVGPSGSGKTTFCNLIARFWDVDQGSIKIGGIDIRDYTLESLMDQISMVFQNVYLFEDTIENNIRFGRQTATRDEVIDAAKKACCHDFIMALPEQYDTIIGEKGFALSGGEKQRISIARAILKDAPIIIFDEATASVDPENEERLQAAILELTKNKTIIMIAHRLKTVRHANQILVIDGGHIVQNGTHQELVEQEGIYKSFIAQRQEAATWEVV